jgi:hypothetical protein
MVPIAAWAPDLPAFNTEASEEALNVIPAAMGYRPLASFEEVTAALPTACRGAVSLRSSAGTTFNFAGTATKLYKMDSGGTSWSDVTRSVGGNYTGTSESWWHFAAFGDYVVATNGVDAPQVFQMGTSTLFAALSGSPPVAAFSCAVRDFHVLGRISSAFNRVKWSGLNDVTAWTTSATTLSDQQDLPDGGQVMGMVGGEYGVIFQEKAITRMSFEGPPTAFRFDRISNTLGCRIERSIAAFENIVFFAADDGFYMLQAGSNVIPIGLEKVDRWFESNFDGSKTANVSAAVDPINKLYVIAFPSINSSDGTADSLLMYNWEIQKWSRASLSLQLVYPAANVSSWTIDGLLYPVDSRFYAGSGRLNLAGFSSAAKQGVFSGANMAAAVETGDFQLAEGRKSLVRGLRPMIEGTSVTPTVTIKYRDRLQDVPTAQSSVSVQSNGYASLRCAARYHRARIELAEGDTWNFITGIDEVKFSPMGLV